MLMLIACGDDDPSKPYDPCVDPELDTMGALIDDAQWSPQSVNVQWNTRDEFFELLGLNACQGLYLGLRIPAQVGGHAIGDDPGTRAWIIAFRPLGAWYSPRHPESDRQGSGTITITEITDDTITGTFSFTAVRPLGGSLPGTRSVTDGSFDVRYR